MSGSEECGQSSPPLASSPFKSQHHLRHWISWASDLQKMSGSFSGPQDQSNIALWAPPHFLSFFSYNSGLFVLFCFQWHQILRDQHSMAGMSEGIFVKISCNVKPWSSACSGNRACLDNDIYFSKLKKCMFQMKGLFLHNSLSPMLKTRVKPHGMFLEYSNIYSKRLNSVGKRIPLGRVI